MTATIQQRIDTLSTAIAKGDLVDADLNVVCKNGWKWTILKVIYTLLQPIYSCFGKDIFEHYRVNHVSTAVLKLCEQPDMSLSLRAKAVTNILGPLDEKTKGRYTKDVEKIKTDVLKIGGHNDMVAQRKTLVQDALGRLSHQLHQRLNANSPTSICFAPVSLAPVLGMILRGLGDDRKGAFLEYLGLYNMPEPIVHLALNELLTDVSKANGELCAVRTANALAAPAGVEIFPEYRQALNGYRAKSFTVSENPEVASKAINEWISEKTEGHIKDLVSPDDLRADDQRTFFALLNSVYFNGKWQKDFNDAVDDQFTFAAGGPQQVKMMSVRDTYSTFDGDTFRMLDIPYRSPEGHNLSHIVFLPNEGQQLPLVEERLTPQFIAHCRQNARREELRVKMPKIDVNVKTSDMINVLQGMGLPVMGPMAQLGNQAELRKIIHQAKVKVDEKGTVAVAATAAIGLAMAGPPHVEEEPRTFHINRDYAYFIVDNNQVLFQGNVRDPAALVR